MVSMSSVRRIESIDERDVVSRGHDLGVTGDDRRVANHGGERDGSTSRPVMQRWNRYDEQMKIKRGLSTDILRKKMILGGAAGT